MTEARRADSQASVETTTEEQCFSVEEQLVVDSEVLVHGGDLIPPTSSDSDLLIPLSSSHATCENVVTIDQQSVAVVEAGQAAAAAKTLVWAYGRPTFYVSPAAVLPTAVVAPIKRETAENLPSSTPQQTVSQSPLPGNVFERSLLSNPAHTPPAPLSKAHLPPFETFRAHAISGGSIAMTSSAPATSPPSESGSSAVNLCLATRSTADSDAARLHVTEPLPLTSLYRQPPMSTSVAFPFPVWNLPTAGLAAEAGTQLRRAVDPLSSAAGQLVASTPLKPTDGHVTGQPLPVQQAAPVTVNEAVTSTSRCFVSSDGNA